MLAKWFFLLLLCASGQAAIFDEHKPRIVNEGSVHRVPVNSTLLLHCQVSGLGPMVLLWKKGHRVLTANSLIVKRDKRLSLRGNNLRITDLTIHDGGEYMCEVEADEPEPLFIVHTVEILVPASLVASEAFANVVEVRQGATATLECRANGNPVPTVQWTFSQPHRKRMWVPVQAGSVSQQGMVLTLGDVDRVDAGDYRCSAFNGVGNHVSRRIRLNVFYPPEISVSNEGRVHAGEGMPVTLSCSVKANPRAEIEWFKNNRAIYSNDIINDIIKEPNYHHETRSELRIDHVRLEDFALYRCEAKNSLARSSKDILLTGRPEQPLFDGQRAIHIAKQQWRISWMTRSFANITEYRLLYRKVSEKEEMTWTNVQLAASPSSPNLVNKVMGHTLRLEPNARFEAIVQARNAFGWGPRSRTIVFDTAMEKRRDKGFEERRQYSSLSTASHFVTATSSNIPESSGKEAITSSASTLLKFQEGNYFTKISSLLLVLAMI